MKAKVLLVDDEPEILNTLSLALKHRYEVKTAFTIESAQQVLVRDPVDVIVTDLNFHGQLRGGIDLIDWLNAKRIQTPVVVLSGEMDIKKVISAQRRISDDYLVKPVDIAELICAVEKARQGSNSPIKVVGRDLHEVLTQDPRILESLEEVKNLMQSDSNLCLLITGESGTGKEEIAKYAASVRGGPFVAVNMATLPPHLQASELFGYTKGAFTGAVTDRIGKFQAANGGVIFLDEINEVTSNCLSTLKNIGKFAEIYLPAAADLEGRLLDKMQKDIDAFGAALRGKKDKQNIRALYPAFRRAAEQVPLHQAISHPELLMRSLFLSLFSFFDAFSGDLIKTIYGHKPELLFSIERQINFNDLLKHASIESVKDHILNKEIETFRRGSYLDQFKSLENRFGLNTLRTFDNWKLFIERVQRRNLITHCDGLVTEQYISECRGVGNLLPEGMKVGQKLALDPVYLKESIELMIEVVLKLSQTLWRKNFPDTLIESDSVLALEVFSSLKASRWKLAEELGKFAVTLTGHRSMESTHRINVINYAQSLKWQGKHEEMGKLVRLHDWSSCHEDFRLAVDVLNDNYTSAAKRMRKIGREGELISEMSYVEWPIFRNFKDTEQFLSAFKAVYKQDFVISEAKAELKAATVSKVTQ